MGANPPNDAHLLAKTETPPTSNQHHADREDLFDVCVGRHVAKSDAGQAAKGEVEGCYVDAANGRPTAGAVGVPKLVVGGL